MLITKKMLLALTLVGALLGAGIGALVTRTTESTNAASNGNETAQTSSTTTPRTPEQIANENASQYKSPEEQVAYRQGFDAGLSSCNTTSTTSTGQTIASTTVYRAPVRRYNGRGVYYDYSTTPRGRTFWQKHRDKLTLAIGTGVGTAIGGIAGGGKGAAIGALAGFGGSALYTYKLRHRHHY